MQISRLYDFQDGTIAFSQQVDDEFNQVIDLVNGKLAADNILPASLGKDKLSFYVSSYWKDPVETFANLATLTPNHGDVVLVKDEPKVYIYDEDELKWKPFLSTTDHGSLEGLDLPDQHPILAITGLRTELDALSGRIGVQEGTAIRTTDLADIDNANRADGRMLVFNAVASKLQWVDLPEVINNDVIGEDTTWGSTKIKGELDAIKSKNTEQDASLLNKEKKIIKADSAPNAPAVDDLWLNTLVTPNVLNRWSGAQWLQVGGSGSGGSSKLTDMTDLSKTGKAAGKHIEVAPNGVDYIHVDKPINDAAASTSITQTWSAKKVNDVVNAAKPDLTPYQKKTDAGKVGTKAVSETGIASGKILKYDGTNVVYADMPATSIAKQLKADLSVSVATNSSGAYKVIPFDRYTGNADGTFAGGIFTAGKDGLYIVDTSVSFDNVLNTEVWVTIVKDGEPGFLLTRGIKPQASTFTDSGATVMSLTAGQKIHVDVSVASSTARIQGGATSWTYLKITKMPESGTSVSSTSQDHSHANMPVLDALGDNDGTLTYNGVDVGGTGGGAVIDDANVSTTKVWSSDKTSLELDNKANAIHSHSASDITDLDVYNKTEIDTKVQDLEDYNTAQDTAISGKSDIGHTHTPASLGMYTNAEIEALIASAGSSANIYSSTVAPTSPVLDLLWIDTTSVPNILKRYDGTTWVQIGATGGGSGAGIDDANATSTTTTYSASKMENTFSKTTHNHNGVYEPVIGTKKTAFNKDFSGNGTADSVSHSDHNHDTSYEAKIATKKTGFNLDVGTTAGTLAAGDHTHSTYSLTTHTHPEIANIGKVGTKTVDETSIGTGKTLQYNGSSLVYVTAPTPVASKQFFVKTSADVAMPSGRSGMYNNVLFNSVGNAGELLGGSYSSTTGDFTVGVAGWYVVNSTVSLKNITASTDPWMGINTPNGLYLANRGNNSSATLKQLSGSVTSYYNVGDKINVQTVASYGTSPSWEGSFSWLLITRLPEGGSGGGAVQTISGTPAKQDRMMLSTNWSVGAANTMTTVPFNTYVTNEIGGFNSGSFTAPAAGMYLVDTSLMVSGTAYQNIYLGLYVNSTLVTYFGRGRLSDVADNVNYGGSYTLKLAASDVVTLKISVEDATTNVLGVQAYNSSISVTRLPEAGSGGGITKYNTRSDFPATSTLGEVGMNLAEYKMYVYKPVNTNQVPTATSGTAPSPLVITESSKNTDGYEGWRIFDREYTDAVAVWATSAAPTVGAPQWVKLDRGVAISVSEYNVITRNDPSTRQQDPKDWKLQYSTDGTNFIDADSRTGITFTNANESKNFKLATPITARYWRFYVTANNGLATFVAVNGLELIMNGNDWVQY